MVKDNLKSLRVAIVEDDDSKYEEIHKTLLSIVHRKEIFCDRAENIISAEDLIRNNEYDLLLLDVSMNITSGRLGSRLGGHANTGGLEIAEMMSLYRINIPTIIITGFDYFSTSGKDASDSLTLNLENLEIKAVEFLQDNFIDCIRYTSTDDWKDRFSNALKDWIDEDTYST